MKWNGMPAYNGSWTGTRIEMGDVPVWHWREVQCMTTDVEQTPCDSVYATDIDIPVCLRPTVLWTSLGKRLCDAVARYGERPQMKGTLSRCHSTWLFSFYVYIMIVPCWVLLMHVSALCYNSKLCSYPLCMVTVDFRFIEADISSYCYGLYLTMFPLTRMYDFFISLTGYSYTHYPTAMFL